MSRITFSTRAGHSADIRGNERAHMGLFVSNLSSGFLPEELQEIENFLPSNHYLKHSIEKIKTGRGDLLAQLKESFKTACAVGFDMPITTIVGPIDIWELQLNTALCLGSPSTQLFVKLHAQCEVHGWVAGSNRQWMASLIENGLKSGLYRRDMGWEPLVEMLRQTNRGAVVSEYSGSDCFHWGKDKLDPGAEISPKTLPRLYGKERTLFDYAA